MTAKQILIEARALIAIPEKWTQRVAARDANGTPALVGSATAISLCPAEAIKLAADNYRGAYRTPMRMFLSAARVDYLRLPFLAESLLAAWNACGGRTHAEVLAVFDIAILGAE